MSLLKYSTRSGLWLVSRFTPDRPPGVRSVAAVIHCQKVSHWFGGATAKPRQVSILLHPLPVGSAPLLWRDWNRRHQRLACTRLHRQRLDIHMEPVLLPPSPTVSPPILSRAQRAHYRLSWAERLARNARQTQTGQLTFKLFSIP